MPGQEKYPRYERLTGKHDFLRVYADGQKWVGRSFVCYVARQQGLRRKVGFVVSRKIGGAVTRHRIKRYLREIYRTARHELAEDVHMVVVARSECAGMDFSACRDAVRKLFRRGDVLSG